MDLYRKLTHCRLVPSADGKKSSSACSPRCLAIGALLLLSVAVIGLFIVIIVVMNKQTNRTDDLTFMVSDMADQVAQMDDHLRTGDEKVGYYIGLSIMTGADKVG